MTSTLRQAVEATSRRLANESDEDRRRGLSLFAASARAAEAKFSSAGNEPLLFVNVDAGGRGIQAGKLSDVTRAVESATAMLAQYRIDPSKAIAQMHSSYKHKLGLVSKGATGDTLIFGFRPYSADTESLFDGIDVESIGTAAARDLIEVLPQSANDQDALASVLALPITQRRGIDYLVQAVNSSALGLDFSLELRTATERAALTTMQAHVIGEDLMQARTETTTMPLHGKLDGMRSRRRIFYIITEDGHEVSGSVAEDVLPLLPHLVDKEVHATVERSVIQQRSGKIGRPTYRLTRIDSVAEGMFD